MTGLLPRWPDSWQSEVIVFSSNTSLVSWISSMPSISSSVDLSLADPYSTAPNGWSEFSAVIVTVERANPGKLLTHRTSGECCSRTVMSFHSNSTAHRSPVLTEDEDDDGDCRKNNNLRSRFHVPFWVCDLLLSFLLALEDGTCWMLAPLSSFSKELALKVSEVTRETLNFLLFISQFGASSIWQANGINQDLIALLWWSFQCGNYWKLTFKNSGWATFCYCSQKAAIGALWKINLRSHFDQSEGTKIGKLRLIKVN